MTKILAIETSCDETAAAVIEDGFIILSNVVASQIDIHRVTAASSGSGLAPAHPRHRYRHPRRHD